MCERLRAFACSIELAQQRAKSHQAPPQPECPQGTRHSAARALGDDKAMACCAMTRVCKQMHDTCVTGRHAGIRHQPLRARKCPPSLRAILHLEAREVQHGICLGHHSAMAHSAPREHHTRVAPKSGPRELGQVRFGEAISHHVRPPRSHQTCGRHGLSTQRRQGWVGGCTGPPHDSRIHHHTHTHTHLAKSLR